MRGGREADPYVARGFGARVGRLVARNFLRRGALQLARAFRGARGEPGGTSLRAWLIRGFPGGGTAQRADHEPDCEYRARCAREDRGPAHPNHRPKLPMLAKGSVRPARTGAAGAADAISRITRASKS